MRQRYTNFGNWFVWFAQERDRGRAENRTGGGIPKEKKDNKIKRKKNFSFRFVWWVGGMHAQIGEIEKKGKKKRDEKEIKRNGSSLVSQPIKQIIKTWRANKLRWNKSISNPIQDQLHSWKTVMNLRHDLEHSTSASLRCRVPCSILHLRISCVVHAPPKKINPANEFNVKKNESSPGWPLPQSNTAVIWLTWTNLKSKLILIVHTAHGFLLMFIGSQLKISKGKSFVHFDHGCACSFHSPRRSHPLTGGDQIAKENYDVQGFVGFSLVSLVVLCRRYNWFDE
jgi:hypothetical protein